MHFGSPWYCHSSSFSGVVCKSLNTQYTLDNLALIVLCKCKDIRSFFNKVPGSPTKPKEGAIPPLILVMAVMAGNSMYLYTDCASCCLHYCSADPGTHIAVCRNQREGLGSQRRWQGGSCCHLHARLNATPLWQRGRLSAESSCGGRSCRSVLGLKPCFCAGVCQIFQTAHSPAGACRCNKEAS